MTSAVCGRWGFDRCGFDQILSTEEHFREVVGERRSTTALGAIPWIALGAILPRAHTALALIPARPPTLAPPRANEIEGVY